jgi:8-oxo-dGTP pyrophosphatase MutT (NUDIX family)
MATLTFADFSEHANDKIWVHYSKVPQVTINPKGFHQDPAGIYLFPSDFNPAPFWQVMPYKFEVEIDPSLRILDLGRLTLDQAKEILRQLEIEIPEKEFTLSIDSFWELMKNHFILKGYRSAGAWNKALRNLGYDAVFDDIEVIHAWEEQLLVLDPTKIKVVKRIDLKDTGYEDTIKVMERIKELVAPYGKVDFVLPRRKTEWGVKTFEGIVHVYDGPKPYTGHYASWKVSPRAHDLNQARPSEISVYYSGSHRFNYSVGESIERFGRGADKKPMDMKELEKTVKKTMDTVWADDSNRVENKTQLVPIGYDSSPVLHSGINFDSIGDVWQEMNLNTIDSWTRNSKKNSADNGKPMTGKVTPAWYPTHKPTSKPSDKMFTTISSLAIKSFTGLFQPPLPPLNLKGSEQYSSKKIAKCHEELTGALSTKNLAKLDIEQVSGLTRLEGVVERGYFRIKLNKFQTPLRLFVFGKWIYRDTRGQQVNRFVLEKLVALKCRYDDTYEDFKAEITSNLIPVEAAFLGKLNEHFAAAMRDKKVQDLILSDTMNWQDLPDNLVNKEAQKEFVLDRAFQEDYPRWMQELEYSGEFDGDAVLLYRGISAESPDTIDFKKLGIYWTWDYHKADNYSGRNSHLPLWIVKARVPFQSINFGKTLRKLVWRGYDHFENEREFELKPRAKIEPIQILKPGETQLEIELPKQARADLEIEAAKKISPEEKLKNSPELLTFYYMADRQENEKQWLEEAKEEFENLDDETIDGDIELYFHQANWDYEEYLEELKKLSPEKRRQKRLAYFETQYIQQKEEDEDSSLVYFENPKILGRTTLYRFTPAKPDEVLKTGFKGKAPERLGLTHHEYAGHGDLAFAFEKKDIKTKKDIEEMSLKYGPNLFEFTVPYAVKAYHNTDYEDQVVFDVTTVQNLKLKKVLKDDLATSSQKNTAGIKDVDYPYFHVSNHPEIPSVHSESGRIYFDPEGIYLFKKGTYIDVSEWSAKKYRWDAKLKPGTKIKLLSGFTSTEKWEIWKKAGIKTGLDAFNAAKQRKDISEWNSFLENSGGNINDPTEEDIQKALGDGPSDYLWFTTLRSYFHDRKKFTQFWKDLGIDGIEDDQEIIYSGEPDQLIIFNPDVIEWGPREENEPDSKVYRLSLGAAAYEFTNWVNLTTKQIEQEWEWEVIKQVKKGWIPEYFEDIEDFKKSVNKSQAVTWTPDLDHQTRMRSHTDSIEELEELVSGYSFPRDVKRIVKGFENNDPIPYPIVLKTPEGYQVLSGNTRLDAAFILGVTPKVLLVDVSKKIKASKVEEATKEEIRDKYANTTSFLYYPVEMEGVDEAHITVKFFGEEPVTVDKIEEILKGKDLSPPTSFTWEPVEFDSKQNGKVRVLELKGLPSRIEDMHNALEVVRKDDYPTYRPHITVSDDIWERVKEEKLLPGDLRVKVLPLQFKDRDVLKKDWGSTKTLAASLPRYFHVTTEKAAKEILRNGFSHTRGAEWYDGKNRFSFSDDSILHDWFNYYHLFFELFSDEEVKELQKTLHDDDLSEQDRARFFRDVIKSHFGTDWTLMWVGRDKVYSGYGDTILEFFPTEKDIEIEDDGAGYTVFVRKEGKIPGSQFEILGKIPEDQDSDMDQGVPFSEIENEIILSSFNDLDNLDFFNPNKYNKGAVWTKNSNLIAKPSMNSSTKMLSMNTGLPTEISSKRSEPSIETCSLIQKNISKCTAKKITTSSSLVIESFYKGAVWTKKKNWLTKSSTKSLRNSQSLTPGISKKPFTDSNSLSSKQELFSSTGKPNTTLSSVVYATTATNKDNVLDNPKTHEEFKFENQITMRGDNDSIREGRAFVLLGDKPVGQLLYGAAWNKPGFLVSTDTYIEPEFRRQGLANALYVFVEKETGMKFAPNLSKSREGRLLWDQPNRPFGVQSSKSPTTREVAIDKIWPDKNNMEVAVDSLHKGMLAQTQDPIEVYPYKNKFVVSDGHHRLLQVIVNGDETVRVKVLPLDFKITTERLVKLQKGERYYGLDSSLENGWLIKRLSPTVQASFKEESSDYSDDIPSGEKEDINGISRHIINFFRSWDYWGNEKADQYSKYPEVEAFLSQYRPKAPVTIYRGLRASEGGHEGHLLRSLGLDTFEKKDVTYRDSRPSSWTTDLGWLKQSEFACDEICQKGLILEATVSPEQVLVDLNLIPEDLASLFDLRLEESEVILRPGSIPAKVIYLSEWKDGDRIHSSPAEDLVLELFHGTCNQNAASLLERGWNGKSPTGAHGGQSKYLYVTNEYDNALWFAQERGCNTVLKVKVKKSQLGVDPEDGIGPTVDDELNRETPAYLVVKTPLPAEAFSTADPFETLSSSEYEDEGHVGDFWGSQASGIMFRCQDDILLLKRSHWVMDPYTWGIPGGAVPVDPKGNPTDIKASALKETEEEIGMIPAYHDTGKKTVFQKGSFKYTTFLFEVAEKFNPILNNEHTDFAWVKIKEILGS